MARALGVDAKRVRTRSFGLNHLAWVYRAWVDGREATDRVFSPRGLKRLGWPPELMSAIRAVPIGYLWYYYAPQRMLSHMKPGHFRSQQVMKLEKVLMKRYADPKLDEPPEELKKRVVIVDYLGEQEDRTGNLLVVAHDGIIRLFVCRVLGIPVWRRFGMKIDPAGITELSWDVARRSWDLIRYNQVIG